MAVKKDNFTDLPVEIAKNNDQLKLLTKLSTEMTKVIKNKNCGFRIDDCAVFSSKERGTEVFSLEHDHIKFDGAGMKAFLNAVEVQKKSVKLKLRELLELLVESTEEEIANIK